MMMTTTMINKINNIVDVETGMCCYNSALANATLFH